MEISYSSEEGFTAGKEGLKLKTLLTDAKLLISKTLT
jgi:hypothetical protein|tara:strand:- start:2947 stop:3057 length:111 start_codon:yes stop_codon:yes gene_type:complete